MLATNTMHSDKIQWVFGISLLWSLNLFPLDSVRDTHSSATVQARMISNNIQNSSCQLPATLLLHEKKQIHEQKNKTQVHRLSPRASIQRNNEGQKKSRPPWKTERFLQGFSQTWGKTLTSPTQMWRGVFSITESPSGEAEKGHREAALHRCLTQLQTLLRHKTHVEQPWKDPHFIRKWSNNMLRASISINSICLLFPMMLTFH